MVKVSADRRKTYRRSVLPGFGPTLFWTAFALLVVVIIPLGGLIVRASAMTPVAFWSVVTSERSLSAFRVSLGCSLVAALVNVGFGLAVAWVLVRYRFPGRRLLDGMVDLPLALPTAVAGIALTTLYAKDGWIGWCLVPFGVNVAFSRIGIVVALVFVGIPFVVRTVQPVIQDIERELEEAAASLGATRWQTFRHVIFPQILPALFVGFSMAFARGLGEYGSVIFIAGNIPKVSEILPLLIVIKLEQFDYAGASVLAVVMLGISFLMLFVMNALQRVVQPGSRGHR